MTGGARADRAVVDDSAANSAWPGPALLTLSPLPPLLTGPDLPEGIRPACTSAFSSRTELLICLCCLS